MKPIKLQLFVFILLFLVFSKAFGQPKKGESLNVSVGLGVTTCYYDVDTSGSGFSAEVEYFWAPLSWFGVKPYAGVIFAHSESEKNEMFEAKVRTKAFLVGTKIRIAAPIPYVAPYIESGFGLSCGSFETFVAGHYDIDKSGIYPHIPLTLGLAVGRKHNFDIKLSYYFQDSAKQIYGSAAVGFSFPLD
ncbi:hypothetical protein [Flavobacterium sp.]|uniref:hypothetical protein n=1 Tax=Flavobacterium sp. TaxID=239 RepID=UPI00121D978B|nr:hypothetical protein [Flavobacterium sp.]RZJ70393.1 MAG: hypothetical protein EOO49_14020 [Flavobacterium sp.]